MGSASIPTFRTFTIPAGADALSYAVDMSDSRGAGIAVPAAWTAANLTFQTSHDGITWHDLYHKSGAEYIVNAAASSAIILPIVDFLGIRFLKIRSGTSAAPVVQAAARDLIVQLVPGWRLSAMRFLRPP